MASITRFAALKYVEGTTAEQKRAILENMLKLYDNEYVVEGSGFQGAPMAGLAGSHQCQALRRLTCIHRRKEQQPRGI